VVKLELIQRRLLNNLIANYEFEDQKERLIVIFRIKNKNFKFKLKQILSEK